ncbi:MAG: histidinol dehydrogenase [Eubacteriales bacterium]
MKKIYIEKGSEYKISNSLNNRSLEDLAGIDQDVAVIMKDVMINGDSSIVKYSKKYDEIDENIFKNGFRVTEDEIDKAILQIEPEIYEYLKEAAVNIASFHKLQIQETWIIEEPGSFKLGQLVQAIENIGIYIPGGKASYPSTVLMNALPAKIAGVGRIAMTTPPMKDGNINPYVLAAAKIAGVDEIYKIGGAQAIAALTYGTESIKPVDKITGPGNIYVARAKRQAFGIVDIDMIAGPSEVCIISDENSNPKYIAADLLAQAEHDEMAMPVLLTTSEILADQVVKIVEEQLGKLSKPEIARASIDNNGLIVVCEDIESCFKISNILAPEHLEILLNNASQFLPLVGNAGAVFLGEYSPEPLGDYFAGPNHTLPTSGTAKFSSPLGVYDFIKRTSVIEYSREYLLEAKDKIIGIADKEGLEAHGRSIAIRFE